MKEPLVSAKIITYNQAPYVAQAIEGVLQQKTNFPFELVIGEDCSTDGTREIVFDYQKRYPDIIKVITSGNNVGANKNGRRAGKACRGKYIAYCDGDDYWHDPHKLQKQADYLESHPDCGLVFSEHDRYFEKNGKTIRRFYRTTNNVPHPNFNLFKGWGSRRCYCNILPCTVMARKNLINMLLSEPYPYHCEQYHGGGDVVFIEVAFISRIHYIDESLSTYRVLIESACRSEDAAFIARFNKSVSECFIHFAGKYKDVQSMGFLRRNLLRGKLRVAFWDNDVQLANEARRTNTHFTFQDWILYLGVKCPVIRCFLHPIMKVYWWWYCKR